MRAKNKKKGKRLLRLQNSQSLPKKTVTQDSRVYEGMDVFRKPRMDGDAVHVLMAITIGASRDANRTRTAFSATGPTGDIKRVGLQARGGPATRESIATRRHRTHLVLDDAVTKALLSLHSVILHRLGVLREGFADFVLSVSLLTVPSSQDPSVFLGSMIRSCIGINAAVYLRFVTYSDFLFYFEVYRDQELFGDLVSCS